MGLAVLAAASAVSTTAAASTVCCDVFGDAGCQARSGSCPPASPKSIELSIPVAESPGPGAVKVLPNISSPPFRGFCLFKSVADGGTITGGGSVCTPGNSGCDPNAPQVPAQCIAVSATADGGPLHETDFATVEVGKALLGGSTYSSHRFESCYLYGDGGQWNTWPNTSCKLFGSYCCTSSAELGLLSSGNGVAVVYP
ncbi:MAG: hypothetical protein JOZ69_24230, partial [Myxococcales bacterium]|nr:hypothetical protein [Myxococcales bacterium]